MASCHLNRNTDWKTLPASAASYWKVLQWTLIGARLSEQGKQNSWNTELFSFKPDGLPGLTMSNQNPSSISGNQNAYEAEQSENQELWSRRRECQASVCSSGLKESSEGCKTWVTHFHSATFPFRRGQTRKKMECQGSLWRTRNQTETSKEPQSLSQKSGRRQGKGAILEISGSERHDLS